MATPLPPLNALRTFEAAAHHLSFTKAADQPVRHPGRGQPSDPCARGAPGRAAVPPHEPGADPDRPGPGAAAGRARGVRSAAGGRAPRRGPVQRLRALNQHHAVLCGELARRQAPRPLPGPASGQSSCSSAPPRARSISPVRASIAASATAPATGRAWSASACSRPRCCPCAARACWTARTRCASRRSWRSIPCSTRSTAWTTGGCGCAPRGCRRSIRRAARSSKLIPLHLQVAVNGAGVGIGRRQLVEAELAAGRLVAPFDFELPDVYAYYFVVPEVTADQPKLAAFRSWLMAEVASSAEAAAQGETPSGCLRPPPILAPASVLYPFRSSWPSPAPGSGAGRRVLPNSRHLGGHQTRRSVRPRCPRCRKSEPVSLVPRRNPDAPPCHSSSASVSAYRRTAILMYSRVIYCTSSRI